MKKVSIIMPIYNVEDYLERSIDSLVNQTLKDIEIILVNDGSTDRSNQIIEYYIERYRDRIKYIAIENGGAAHARNIGMKMAEGEYIGFVDSDDYVDRTMFEKLYNLAKKEQSDIATCGYYRIDYKDVQKRDIALKNCFGKNIFQAPDLLTNNVPYIWNKLYKHSLIEEYNIKFEENLRIYEDLVFTFKLFLHANRISRVNEPLYNYIFSRDNSLTFSFSEKRFDLFNAFDSLIGYYKDKKAFYHFEDELLFILMNHIYVVCGSEVQLSKLHMKYKFINQSFSYMAKYFPYWKDYVIYYRKYKKNRFLFTKKLHWYLNSLIPRRVRKVKKNLNAFMHTLTYNKAGSYFYREYSRNNIINKRVLINSQHGSNLSGNMFYILKELCTNDAYKDFEIGITYDKNKTLVIFQAMIEEYKFANRKLSFIKNNSKEYTKYLATAKYLFNDTSFPVYFIKNEEQIYLNTWHGTPLKTLGRSTANDYYDIANLQKNFLAADYLLYPSNYMKDCMLKDYMISNIAHNKILKCGYPRNEIFFDKERELKIRQKYKITNQQVIAYMPTWRGNVRSVSKKQQDKLMLYLDEIDNQMHDNQRMYVNLHPFVANEVDYNIYKHIYKFPDELETYDFLNCCDILITDYSSVFFDYAVSRKKIILFAYDEEEYFRDRGVYMKFSELPFKKVNTVSELMKEIHSNANDVDYEGFISDYCNYERKDISKLICNHVILQKENGLCIEKTGVECDTMLVMSDDFRNVKVNGSLNNFCEKYYSEKSKVFLSYETQELRDKLFFKELQRNVDYMGTLNRFSCNSLFVSIILNAIESHKLIYTLFKKTISKAMQREWKRSFPTIDFTRCLIFGYSDVKNTVFIANTKGKKYIYIENPEYFNKNVHVNVYEQFDKIIFKNHEVLKKCGYFGSNAIVKECTSFQDFK